MVPFPVEVELSKYKKGINSKPERKETIGGDEVQGGGETHGTGMQRLGGVSSGQADLSDGAGSVPDNHNRASQSSFCCCLCFVLCFADRGSCLPLVKAQHL